MEKNEKAGDEELERIKLRKMRKLMQRQTKPEFPNKPITLSGANLEETANKSPLLVVDLWSARCPPCLMIAPIIEQLANDYAGKVVFGKLNVDENPAVAMKYNAVSIPTLLFFKDGKLVDRVIGAVPKEHIEWKIKKTMERGERKQP